MEDTAHNIHKNAVILYLAIVVLAGFVVWQQQEISQMRSTQTSPVSSKEAVPSQNQAVFNQAEAIRSELLTSKTISGIVVSSNSSEVVIKTNLVDLSALDTFDFKKSQTLPALDKNLTISITSNTVVSGGKLVAGGAVTIQTKEPVYGGGVLTAVSVNVFVPPKAMSAPTVPK